MHCNVIKLTSTSFVVMLLLRTIKGYVTKRLNHIIYYDQKEHIFIFIAFYIFETD